MRGTGRIEGGQIFYDKELFEYLNKYDGFEVDIELHVLSKPEHYLYRYLFGFLIKDIAKHSGDSVERIKDDMKEMFAKEHVESWADVPRRHRGKRTDRFTIVNTDGEVVDLYYIKSCSYMNHEELQEFVKNVENHFFDFMVGALERAKSTDAYENRKKGLMNSKQLKKYLEDA